MLLSKKFIKYTSLLLVKKFLLYFALTLSKNQLNIKGCLKTLNAQKKVQPYKLSYLFKFNFNTKYLFLFTIYIIYSKLNTFLNSFFFKFNINTIKKRKFTILRAPCNHKNSKEQFGLINYKAQLWVDNHLKHNKFYNNFLLVSLIDNKKMGLTEIFLTYKKQNVS